MISVDTITTCNNSFRNCGKLCGEVEPLAEIVSSHKVVISRFLVRFNYLD